MKIQWIQHIYFVPYKSFNLKSIVGYFNGTRIWLVILFSNSNNEIMPMCTMSRYSLQK